MLVGTKFLNTKQFPAGLSPRIIPIVPLIIHRKLWRWGRIPPNSQKIYSIIPPKKFPLLNLLFPLSSMSFLPPPKSDFHLITLYKLHFWLYPWLLYHCLSSGFMHICVMPTLINRCLLNVAFDMTKALNGQSSPKKNFYSLHLPILLGKPCLSLCLFSSFSTPFFISNFMKLQLTPLQLGLRGLSANQI